METVMSEHSKFHRGERAIQQRAGETAQADRNVSVLTDTVIGGARPFIGKQSMAVVASMDAKDGVWASVLFGQPGFAHTETGKSVALAVPAQQRDATDPFWTNIDANASIGMLFIELGSRRRYRVNGKLASNDASGIEVEVIEAYPNCPKYIQRRNLRAVGETGLPATAAQGSLVEGDVAAIVRQADTLFVASCHPEFGADVSHRGGAAGFITILDAHTLRIPDYPGNCLYNTFGNFEVNPRAGLCIPDFPGNRLLQLSGEVVLRWDMPDPDGQTGGTARFWDFRVEHSVVRNTPQRLEWEYLDPSPFNMPLATV
jgi:predicted pyridoxine 5'-phosphate oxidase superfamily flavin-nucleotide-binding protein